ncbi:hypothetical protein [Pareuzebyella sediminis]|uniref:hypothetical protein n=1 Tax=Pareuzebyella sediminis TaxID=2607998 RepID=UPI0011EB9FB0|nr:hypothetical protein [Pareuzebyella sediminis]
MSAAYAQSGPPLAPATLQSFLWDNGNILLISLFISSLLFLAWYFGINLPQQHREKRQWLSEHSGLLRQQLILRYLLHQLGHWVYGCSRCQNTHMQLWNCQEQVLVVRCRSCKMNYTLTETQSKLVPMILSTADGGKMMVNTLMEKRHEALGKFLMQKFTLDHSSVASTENPLGAFHFTAKSREQVPHAAVRNIYLREWEVVSPN